MSGKPVSNRPLSPHLQVYSFTMLMALSILHRITGVGLYFGFILFAWWLFAAASGNKAYDVFYAAASSYVGIAVLLAATWGLFHHMFGGLRHFVWDTGTALGVPCAKWLGRLGIVAPILLTIGVFALGYCARYCSY